MFVLYAATRRRFYRRRTGGLTGAESSSVIDELVYADVFARFRLSFCLSAIAVAEREFLRRDSLAAGEYRCDVDVTLS